MQISIIVPIFNVEPYLPHCLDSILNQTYKEFELILIDDGSTDQSGEICDEYALKDNRIRVVHQINQGVSAARNAGLDMAKGEYVVFVDPDDTISPDFMSNIGLFDKYPELDLVLISPMVIQGKLVYRSELHETFINDSQGVYECLLNINGGVLGVCWGMIFKKETYFGREHAIRFPIDRTRGEDSAIYMSILKKTSHVYVSTKGCYNYTYRVGSLVNSPWEFTDLEKALMTEMDLFYEVSQISSLKITACKCNAYWNINRFLRYLNFIQKGYVDIWKRKFQEPRLAFNEIMRHPLWKMKLRLLACHFIGFTRFCIFLTGLLYLWLYINPNKFRYKKSRNEFQHY